MVIIPESASVDLRRDLVAVPVLDAPVVTTVIAWPQLSRSRAVADLIRVATLPRTWPTADRSQVARSASDYVAAGARHLAVRIAATNEAAQREQLEQIIEPKPMLPPGS